MHLCEFANESIAVMDLKFDSLLALKGNRLVGLIGSLYDRLMIKPEKRKCNLVPANEPGKRLANSSYTGVLRILEQKLASFVLKPDVQFFDEDFIEIDQPCLEEEFLILQQLDASKNKRLTSSVLDSLNFDLCFLLTVALFFLAVCIALHVLKLKKSNRPAKQNLWRKFSGLKFCWLYTLSAIGVFLLFYDLHLFFSKLLMSNSIQTEKVIYDTSELLKNAEDVLATKKVACFIETGLEMRLAANAPRTNLIRRALEDKTYSTETGKRCLHKNLGYEFSLLNRFTIMSKTAAVIFLYLLNTFKTHNVLWMNANFVLETNLFFYMRKGAPDGKRFKATNLRYHEIGLPLKMVKEIASYKNLGAVKNSNFVFTTLEEYVSDYATTFESMTFQNYEAIFWSFGFVCLLLLLLAKARWAVGLLFCLARSIRRATLFP